MNGFTSLIASPLCVDRFGKRRLPTHASWNRVKTRFFHVYFHSEIRLRKNVNHIKDNIIKEAEQNRRSAPRAAEGLFRVPMKEETMSMFVCEYDWSAPRIESESCRDRQVRKMAGSDWVQSASEGTVSRRKSQGRKVRK